MRNLFIFFISIIILSCSGGSSGEKSKGLLQPASGRPGEIIVVIDSTQWAGQIGEAIRTVFRKEVEGLPREQAMFKLNQVEPQSLNNVLKTVRNLIFVTTMDSRSTGARVVRSYFTKSSLERIQKDSDLFVYTADDEFARGQKVMYLFGQTENQLANHIYANDNRLQTVFNNVEDDRLFSGLYKAKEVKGISNMLIEDHQCYMRVPFGYQLVVNQKGFVWVRQINDESDKNVFISYMPYRSESVFQEENLVKLRDSIAMSQLFEDPADPATHIVTDTSIPFIPFQAQQTTFNDNFAVQMKGIWKTNNLSMGGPFLSYALVDEELNRLYYIEGFLYSPGKPQREFMRELKIILSTFRTSESLPVE